MMTQIHSSHFTDEGKPDGGGTYGQGFCITWQRGPLGRGEDREEPNGAFVEDIITAAMDRILFYQNETPFACDENAKAIEHLELALKCLKRRTMRREASGTEGTHEGN